MIPRQPHSPTPPPGTTPPAGAIPPVVSAPPFPMGPPPPPPAVQGGPPPVSTSPRAMPGPAAPPPGPAPAVPGPPPAVPGPPPAARPVSASPPAASAPPVWPPVAPEREGTPPPVPETLAAALDMTAEMPKVRPDAPAPPAAAAKAPARPTPDGREATPPSKVPARSMPDARDLAPSTPAPVPATPPVVNQNRQRFIDETMELPIFRELESAWFRTTHSGTDEPARTGSDSPGEPAEQPVAAKLATVDSGRPDTTPNGEAAAPGTAAETAPVSGDAEPVRVGDRTGSAWETAADDGWRAASAAAEVNTNETTTAGLPKRVPMAQLVPGGVDREAATAQRRTPEGVRGLLSAYHRGVQRGRTQPKDDQGTNSQPTTAGQQSSQAGKEHEE
jgi:hypothetical protein